MTGACRVLITGAAGVLGRTLANRLAREGRLGARPISTLILSDLAPLAPTARPACPVETRCEDLTEPLTPIRLAALAPDVVLHLAATVEGQASADFAAGYAINFDAPRALFEAIRRAHLDSGGRYVPRVVFASSIAVFAAPLPAVVDDAFQVQPGGSYGAQKAMVELLLCDYVRKGVLDGVAPRLATIAPRPGPPGRGASAFFSNILAEPLRGRPAVAPVPLDLVHWLASPRAAVAQLIHAATMDADALGARRALTMPGVGASMADLIAALRRVGGERAVALVRHDVDPALERMFRDGPARFDARRARELGFPGDADVDAMLRAFVEDELGDGAPA